jgi:uncharacterized protein
MPHISLVTLGVDDLRAATRFYEAIGWRTSAAASVPGTVAFLGGGNVALSLFSRHDLAEDAHLAPGRPVGFRGVALATNVGSEAEVDALLETATSAGGRIRKVAEHTDWGGYSGYFTDPDGHLWEVAYNPHFELLDDGRLVLPFED